MKHISQLCLLLSLTLTAICQLALAADPVPRHIIDTHIHIYDTAREGGVPWPRENDKELYYPHLPADWKKAAKPAGVTHTVIVEASILLEDNQWVLDVTKDDPFFPGLVGRLEPADKDFSAQVKRFSKDPRFVGIRPRLGEADLDDPVVAKNLKLLEQQGLTLDHLMNSGMTPAKIADLAGRYPKLTIIVDHAVGYRPNGKPLTKQQQEELALLGKHKNVYCKVSGLFEHCVEKPAPTDLDYHRPILDGLWVNFGQDRLIFASNWPVIRKGGTLADHVKLVDQYFSEKGDAAVEAVFWKNAVEAYGLRLK